MATVRKTITVTEQQDRWIKSRIKNGEFTNDSEYLRDLLRKDQEKNTDLLVLQAELQKGLDSGFSSKKRTVEEIFDAAEKRYKAKQKIKENA